MNVYDEAHNLARAIKESGEFAEFDKLRKEVENDKEVTEMLGEFQQLQLELQALQMQGKQPEQATISRMQSLGAMIATKPLAARYMQAQGAFSVMMNDVFQIIGDAVGIK